MRQNKTTHGDRIVKDIKRKTRKQYSAEEKIRIVLDGLRGTESVAELAVSKVYPKAFITNGPRTFWRPARNDSPEISPAKPTQLKSKGCALKRVS